MVRKPASMYRRITGMAYARREYMGGVPAVKISQFDMGNLQKEDDFPVKLTLRVKSRVQIRHTAIEAGRIAANRVLTPLGNDYHFKVRVYPHIVLRENKLATGAGADRVSSGMRRAFGKTVGTAARVEGGQAVYTIYCSADKVRQAKDALWRASMKLPTSCYIDVEKGQELIH